MDLYIGPLAADTDIDDVKAFLGRLAKGANVHIVECTDDDEKEHRYAIAAMGSERKAHKVIKKLNGKDLADQRVVIRPYHHRAVQNERRAPALTKTEWKATERREGDRRRMSCRRTPDDDIF